MKRLTMRKTAGAVLVLALLAAPAAGALPAPGGAVDWLGSLWERALEWLGAPLVMDDADAAPGEASPPPPSSGNVCGDCGGDIDPDG